MPVRLISSVRGIGVAVSVSTSTSVLSFFIASLWLTPNRCSSSTTSRPSRLNVTSSDSSRCVPITMSTSPLATPSTTRLAWPGVRKRDSTSTRSGYAAMRSLNVGEVLLREESRGDEHADLHPVLHGLERGADRDLGLAEADVAADEAIHRRVVLHVGLHVGDGLQLVGRLDVGERLLHLVLPRRVGCERVTR